MKKSNMSAVRFILVLCVCLIHGTSCTNQVKPESGEVYSTEMLPGEYWWGGLTGDGIKMPYDVNTDISKDLWGDDEGNQAQPLFISNKGRYIWSEEPIAYKIKEGKLVVSTRTGKILSGTAGKTLKDAFLFCSSNFFPSNGKIPDPLMFTAPQYNTWIELMYNQNEEDILKYAQSIIDNGYPAGVLMIDDNWQEDYGDWNFSTKRFRNPKEMIDRLHKMGFAVMLWVCPFVSPDSETFRLLAKEGMLMLEKQPDGDIKWENTQGKVAMIKWWNGISAELDLSNPETMSWFKERLDKLMEDYGVDGFKFDAGNVKFYTNGIESFMNQTPVENNNDFLRLGFHYPLNEFRATWKMAGQPLTQRLKDKEHKWEDLQQLVPGITAQGILGYAYTCPDMIGGGEYQSFLHTETIDEELIVRSAQTHALMPMMQFSVAPWRVLSPENNAICCEMAKLHSKVGNEIIELALKSSKNGEPIARLMAYNYPDNSYEKIHDQFMLGIDILVAPVLEKGARTRKVVFPQGKWSGDDGSEVDGGKTIEIDVPLNRLPYYRRIK